MRLVLVMAAAAATCATFSGCADRASRISGMCAEMEAVSRMTDDCDKMRSRLEPLAAEFAETMSGLESGAPDDAAVRDQIAAGVSVCTRALLEISTGTCGLKPDIGRVRTP